MRIRKLRRSLDLGLAGAGPAIGDVVRSERWNRIGSCCTIAICWRNEACVAAAMFWPSIRMLPSFTS